MALPFDLPQVSRGHAALEAGARRAGLAVAEAAARSVGQVLGLPVQIVGRALPGRPAPPFHGVRLPIELGALPGVAQLEVEPALVADLVRALSGGPPGGPATDLSPLEDSALELLVLAALDGAAEVPAVEARLAPRLGGRPAPPVPGQAAASPLAVDLALEAGAVRGRARLLLPPAALRALADPPGLAEPLLSLPLFASLRAGAAPLLPEELAALQPGDVVLVDPPPEGRHRLVFPGGFTAVGPAAGGTFTVERTTMDERLAEIPVVLEVELARVPLTLADLARLVPGATLPLHLDKQGLVALRLGERAVARGELVDVDGAVGVRILSMEVAP
jgi:type III secretion protein Q